MYISIERTRENPWKKRTKKKKKTDGEFNLLLIKMLNELGNRINNTENFNKELENIWKNHTSQNWRMQ